MTRVQDGSGGAAADAAGRRGFGFGLFVDEWEGTRRLRHDGAVYGASTLLVLLPDAGLGVVATAAKDCVQRVLFRHANDALRRARALRDGREPPVLTALDAAPLTVPPVAAAPTTLPPRPAPPPPELVPLLGEYGPDHAILYVREADGRLETQVEWHFTDRPSPAGADRFVFPDGSLYEREELRFVRDGLGSVIGAFMAGIWFERRAIEPQDGAAFRVTPAAPLAELELAARLAAPPAALLAAPRAPDLVDLAALDAGLRFDIRYATADNFLGAPVYSEARAFLQRPAAQALARARARLAAEGLGLVIHDGYRPWHVTKLFFDATPPRHHGMVADPNEGSRHNRGAAVDLSLCDGATGELLAAPSGYDEFSPRANPRWPGGTAHQRWVRDVLRIAMEAEGFTVHPEEWWHFDFDGWREWPVLNRTFDQLAGTR
jgi:serine beta-lactamase-like protein LACTB